MVRYLTLANKTIQQKSFLEPKNLVLPRRIWLSVPNVVRRVERL